MKFLITGGAGFIGVHTARHFAQASSVHIVDNLSRRGTQANLDWLKSEAKFSFAQVDIRDVTRLEEEVAKFKPDVVIHLAAQVAVTTSVQDPRTDFEINALGTFNVLEAVRKHAPGAMVLYSSTNKVYGGMEEVRVELAGDRYRYADLPFGVPETYPLDFHSPYGCSKGAADQYVRDYGRIYEFPTVVFRQSCIYGTRQFGVEDQGWIAWFTIASTLGRPITVYGDGKQVRDVLWVDDLVAAFSLAVDKIDSVRGEVFNMGGGPQRQLSLLETFDQLGMMSGTKVPYTFADWRPGDQKVFVADTRKAEKALGWSAQVDPVEGVKRLSRWVQENKALFTV
ncbi:MAG TPA: GDP-mannose 4,6-dehydratase [Polyangiaceae bacterium]|jgi:CDP-paratose 2-epimerase|nr:GDP-mannose 4,6-dehydratase [Polyangiaceae bacterium]